MQNTDTFARALLIASDLLQNSNLESLRTARYALFDSGAGADFEAGRLSLADLARIGTEGGEPAQISGQQQLHENIINSYIR